MTRQTVDKTTLTMTRDYYDIKRNLFYPERLYQKIYLEVRKEERKIVSKEQFTVLEVAAFLKRRYKVMTITRARQITKMLEEVHQIRLVKDLLAY